MGIGVGTPKLDLPTMMTYKDEGVDGNVKGVEFLFKKNKIDAVHGTGRIAAPGKVEVKARRRQDPDARDQEHRHRHRLRRGAAAGHRDRREAHRLLDRRADARQGAGAAAGDRRRRDRARARLGLAAARRRGDGGRVPRPHPARHGRRSRARSSSACSRSRASSSSSASKVTGVDKSGKALKAKIEPAKGGAAETIEADVVLVAIGREPYTEGLGLEGRGRRSSTSAAASSTDAHFATNVPGIYAIGDVIAGPMLAHKAEDEGIAVAEIIAGQAGHVNYDAIPNVVYTYPGDRLGRQDRRGTEGRGRRLQGRQIPVHRQRPRQGNQHDRRLREDPRRRQDRPRARRAHRRRRRRQDDRAKRRSRWSSAPRPRTSPAPATRTRRCRKR